jgi:hypothetical protein
VRAGQLQTPNSFSAKAVFLLPVAHDMTHSEILMREILIRHDLPRQAVGPAGAKKRQSPNLGPPIKSSFTVTSNSTGRHPAKTPLSVVVPGIKPKMGENIENAQTNSRHGDGQPDISEHFTGTQAPFFASLSQPAPCLPNAMLCRFAVIAIFGNIPLVSQAQSAHRTT